MFARALASRKTHHQQQKQQQQQGPGQRHAVLSRKERRHPNKGKGGGQVSQAPGPSRKRSFASAFPAPKHPKGGPHAGKGVRARQEEEEEGEEEEEEEEEEEDVEDASQVRRSAGGKPGEGG